MPRGVRQGSGLAAPFTLSALLHASLAIVLFNTLKERKPVALPPMYRVNIVAAPPGERAVGEVNPPSTPPRTSVTQPTPAPSTIKEAPVLQPKPAIRNARATATDTKTTTSKTTKTRTAPSTDAQTAARQKTQAPKAGGGPIGDKGTDVATVRAEGIEFPFPGYLNNIVRQIALNFQPRNPSARLRAVVRFLIHRDGSVSNIEFITKSGDYRFDLDAQGAVEAASTKRAFGPLPTGFPDDVLPVVFSFDPEFLK